MDAWDGWPRERLVYLFLAAAYLLVWIQVSLFHWRGNFRNGYMWGPVLFSPLLVAVAVVIGVVHGTAVEVAFAIIYGIGVAQGLMGVLLHARGVSMLVGGFNRRNIMVGPPIILPVIYAALAALGLINLYWNSIVGAAD